MAFKILSINIKFLRYKSKEQNQYLKIRMILSKLECTIRNFNLYSSLLVIHLSSLIPHSLPLTPSSYLVSINLKLTPKSDDETG